MNKNDFHIPFIKSLLIIGLATIIAMISSHYLIDYCFDHSKYQYSSSYYDNNTSTNEQK